MKNNNNKNPELLFWKFSIFLNKETLMALKSANQLSERPNDSKRVFNFGKHSRRKQDAKIQLWSSMPVFQKYKGEDIYFY